MEELRIEYLPPDALKPYDRNARRHTERDIEAIKASIRENGFCDPVGIWGPDNLIVEGHGRILAAKDLGLEEIPCIRLDHLTDEQRREYALAHNRTAELSEWDEILRDEEIAALEDAFDMAAFGFDTEADDESSGDWFDREDKDGDDTEGESEEYAEFVDKFKPKKTTDDCYTPANIYDAVTDWVGAEYGVQRSDIVRPFYPGGDYQAEEYPDGCCVVDNPPFSILAEILRFYMEHGIRFFLFAPTLTLFSGRGLEICYIPCYATITYENGAMVNTSFITNMDREYRIRTAPDLCNTIRERNDENLKSAHKELPKYSYPDEVVTAIMAARWCRYGVDFRVPASECCRITELDAQKKAGKAVFGGGYLLSNKSAAERAAAERAAAERWTLSDREKEIVRKLSAGAEGSD